MHNGYLLAKTQSNISLWKIFGTATMNGVPLVLAFLWYWKMVTLWCNTMLHICLLPKSISVNLGIYAEKNSVYVLNVSTKWYEYEPSYSFLGFGKSTVKELKLNVIPWARTVQVITFLDHPVTILAKHGMMLLWIQALTKWVHAQQRICLAPFTYSTLRTLHLTSGFHFLRRYSL